MRELMIEMAFSWFPAGQQPMERQAVTVARGVSIKALDKVLPSPPVFCECAFKTTMFNGMPITQQGLFLLSTSPCLTNRGESINSRPDPRLSINRKECVRIADGLHY
jgi:hypothetical protein